MSLAGKAWGETRLVFSNSFVEVHRVFIDPRRRCSRHQHQFKWNLFFVLQGTLYVKIEKNDYPLVDCTELKVGDCTLVQPGEWHWFETHDEPCEAFEIYFPQPLGANDIVRRDHGGELKQE